MKRIIYFFCILTFLTACKQNSKQVSYQLVWEDNFDYIGLPDSTKWNYDTEGNSVGWGNKESQHYTHADKDNAWVENGVLRITARKEKIENKEFSSARLMSIQDWKYGKIEIRAKVPAGRGTWAAIWMMPGGWSFNDGNWPDVGEIDIMEHVGHDLGVIHASMHSKDYQWQKGTQKTATIKIPEVDTEFHTYSIEWDEKVIKAFVDNQQYFEYENEGLGESKWPYNKAYYLIMNIAVGGAWGIVEGIDENAFPQTMEIDFVKVYQTK